MRKIWVGLSLSLALVTGAHAGSPSTETAGDPDKWSKRCAVPASNAIGQFRRGDEFSRADILK
jgi:hypothetical protein